MKHFKKPDDTIYAYELDGSQDHLITPDMVPCDAPVPPPLPEPTLLEQIRAVEDDPAVKDAATRAARLVAMGYALDLLILKEASRGRTVTREQAHAWALVNDRDYGILYGAEQTIKVIKG